MRDAVINVKTDQKTKTEAKKLANSFGLSLGGVINALLREFVRSRRLELLSDEPSEYMIKSLKESEADYAAGRYHSFKNGKEAVAFLKKISKEGYED